MMRQINRVTGILMLLILILILNVSYVQVFEAKHLRSEPGNQRVLLNDYSRKRGAILVGSKSIAFSQATNDALKYLRKYPDGSEYAAVTGFYSQVYGATALEHSENDILAGNDSRFFVNRVSQLLANRKPAGGAVRLTINAAAQQAAMRGLAGRTGAVIAIDPTSGALLAIASSPSFDPNLLSSHDPNVIQQTYEALSADPKEPMLNRALAMALPPGSTFKLVTAAAALESGRYTLHSVLPGPARIKLPQSDHFLSNWTGQACGAGDKVTLERALAISCNTAFAWLGMKLGASALRTQAEKFGFETSFNVPMTSATSHFPKKLDKSQTAMSAIGQFDVQATALQMAMVSASIANGGLTMTPYLVSQVLGPDLNTLQNATPTAFGRSVSPNNATSLQAAMLAVVNSGTGSNARIYGTKVGGKTGTAQNAPGSPAHAWFTGWAKSGTTKVAVAVVLQNGGGAREISGNGLAAPIARAVMRAALGQ
jgi:peptidoglycan glycosyltransferase